MATPAHRLVIGLDYGTTFTGMFDDFYSGLGVAYQEVTGTDNSISEIVISNWPKTVASSVAEKVPSEISYSPAPGGERQWGYDFGSRACRLVWTKLELGQQRRPEELQMILDALNGMENLNFDTIRRSGGLPEYPAKDPVDIVADYLTYVREHLMENLVQDYGPHYISTVPVDIFFTVPAVWSDLAKNRTFRAISKAGFDESNFKRLREVIMVSEPEAAALYTLKDLRTQDGEESINPGDCFVLCDAGGGTVDLISYCIRQLAPAIQLEEVTIGTGANCGATYIDRNFKKWLEVKLGAADYQILAEKSPENDIGSHTIVDPKMQEIMKQFENIKTSFKGIGDPRERIISLPRPLDQLHDPSRGIDEGEIRITDADLRVLFDPQVKRTIELVNGQIAQVQRAGYRVNYVFLTGGFGQSGYLTNELRRFTRERRIPLRSPEHGWSAVVRGAVAKGLQMGTGKSISIRKCRRHYGVSVSQPFSSFKHAEENAYVDPFDGEKKFRGQMIWLLKKGDALLSNQPKHASIEICRKFGLKDSRVFQTNLIACDCDDAPTHYAEATNLMRTVASLKYDFSDIPTKKFKTIKAGARGLPYLCAYFRLEVRLENDLEFKMFFDGQEMGTVTATYE